MACLFYERAPVGLLARLFQFIGFGSEANRKFPVCRALRGALSGFERACGRGLANAPFRPANGKFPVDTNADACPWSGYVTIR